MGKMNLKLAKRLIKGAEQEAKNIGVSMVISIVDEGGDLIAIHRMDDAWLASIDIAHNKAWTSVALKMPTEDLAEAALPQGELYGINTTNNGRIVIFGGGFPLEMNDRVIGGVGVSGSSVKDDVQVAQAAVNVFDQLKLK